MKKQNSKTFRDYYSNFIKYSFTKHLPKDLLLNAENYFNQVLISDSQLIRLPLSKSELNSLVHDFSRIAVIIHGFGIHCFKLKPYPDAPINMTLKNGFLQTLADFKKSRLLSEEEYLNEKKCYEEHFNYLDKIYLINEPWDYAVENSIENPIEKISIELKINPKFIIKTSEARKYQNTRDEKVRVDIPEIGKEVNIELAPNLYPEIMHAIQSTVEKFTGRIAMYRDLSLKREFGLGVFTRMIREAGHLYFREKIFSNKKHTYPDNNEKLLNALLLVAAGFLPTENEYNKSRKSNGDRPIYKKENQPTYRPAKIKGKIIPGKVRKPKTLSYTTYLMDQIKDPKSTRLYYHDISPAGYGYNYIEELM